MTEIARATAEECPQLADIQFDAFYPSVIHQAIFGNVRKEDHSAHLAKTFAKCVDDEGAEVFKAFVKDEQGNEKIVGMAFWDLPKDKKKEEEKKAKAEEEKKNEKGKTEEEKKAEKEKRFPKGTNVDLAASFFGQLDPKTDEPFIRLHLLAIDPSVQRTGAGAKLVQWGCREADRLGVASYLEATDVGIGLYKRYGYEMWNEPIVGGENNELILWPMRRPPLEIRTFRRSDFPAMCEIYYEAFEPTTIWKYNFSKVTREASNRCFKKRLENWFDEIDNDGNTCTDNKEVMLAVRGKEVLGFAVWDKLPEKSERKQKKAPYILPEGADEERTKELFDAIRAATGEYEKKHWYLGLLAVHPKVQKGGIGRLLCQWGIDRAQKDGSDVLLGSTEFGKALYESLGFKELGKPVAAPQDSSVINWTMVLRHDNE
ncbi:hypothetical protein JCM3765_000189 [Sporobolomyces pararoseus]